MQAGTRCRQEQGAGRNKVQAGTRCRQEQGAHRNKMQTGTRSTQEQGAGRIRKEGLRNTGCRKKDVAEMNMHQAASSQMGSKQAGIK